MESVAVVIQEKLNYLWPPPLVSFFGGSEELILAFKKLFSKTASYCTETRIRILSYQMHHKLSPMFLYCDCFKCYDLQKYFKYSTKAHNTNIIKHSQTRPTQHTQETRSKDGLILKVREKCLVFLVFHVRHYL